MPYLLLLSASLFLLSPHNSSTHHARAIHFAVLQNTVSTSAQSEGSGPQNCRLQTASARDERKSASWWLSRSPSGLSWQQQTYNTLDFEKKSLGSKKNIKHAPQRDLRDKKTKAERGQENKPFQFCLCDFACGFHGGQ
ncbi:hypothetical protein N7481_006734 [Penicillium waksmanii]|uniref:uncharacterized protein n=1 Tax=Penicillium waksmanii TaxID=69791 RepID=UPI002548978D|nr:uncharacterized protein N7481_006734 [Penicillium waksmanii]KAJ5984635.1 hypothetical protein N7481_006734 [Penicillium waksmanii]